jgi:ADP-ribosylglycohydrolase
MIGAAIGDALGMANETGPSTLGKIHFGYQRAWRVHPNAGLAPGQYTDDTQIMLMVAELFADGNFSGERYARELKQAFDAGALRFPDASITAACEHMERMGMMESGVMSTTSGCLNLAVVFGLVCDDSVELRERLVGACSITHTHPEVHAAAIGCAMLIRAALSGSSDPVAAAYKTIALEDEELSARIRAALMLEADRISLDGALSVIGNDVSVFQTLPAALFLLRRYEDPEQLLTIAANIGGNTDTIGFICGACVGAQYGAAVFPDEFLFGLEGRERIESLALRLHDRYARKD